MPCLPDWGRPLGNDQGFTFIEILVASAIFVMVLLGVYVIYDANQSTYIRGEGSANLQQNARVALEEMIRELLMAGYDPTRVLADPATYNQPVLSTTGRPITNYAMQSLGADTVRFLADVNEDGTTEVVEFSYSAASRRINRQIWTWNAGSSTWSTAGAQAITENNTMNSLAFTYRDQSNAVTAVARDVNRIDVSISGTIEVGSQGTQSLSLHSTITPRNL